MIKMTFAAITLALMSACSTSAPVQAKEKGGSIEAPASLDQVTVVLQFPTRTVTGKECGDAEFEVLPEYGTLVANCSSVGESDVPSPYLPTSLGYLHGVRLNEATIYTECQTRSVRRTGVGSPELVLIYLCLEP